MSISNLISEDTRKEMAELKILINKYVQLPRDIRLCKWCNKELFYSKGGSGQGYIKEGYCDILCKELFTPMKEIRHRCFDCKEPVGAFIRATGKWKGLSSGIYPKRCEECREIKLLKTKKHK